MEDGTFNPKEGHVVSLTYRYHSECCQDTSHKDVLHGAGADVSEDEDYDHSASSLERHREGRPGVSSYPDKRCAQPIPVTVGLSWEQSGLQTTPPSISTDPSSWSWTPPDTSAHRAQSTAAFLHRPTWDGLQKQSRALPSQHSAHPQLLSATFSVHLGAVTVTTSPLVC